MKKNPKRIIAFLLNKLFVLISISLLALPLVAYIRTGMIQLSDYVICIPLVMCSASIGGAFKAMSEDTIKPIPTKYDDVDYELDEIIKKDFTLINDNDLELDKVIDEEHMVESEKNMSLKLQRRNL